jgi:hypothetical protein
VFDHFGSKPTRRQGAEFTRPNPGLAYVFVHSGTVWSLQAKLTASDAAANDLFGYS